MSAENGETCCANGRAGEVRQLLGIRLRRISCMLEKVSRPFCSGGQSRILRMRRMTTRHLLRSLWASKIRPYQDTRTRSSSSSWSWLSHPRSFGHGFCLKVGHLHLTCEGSGWVDKRSSRTSWRHQCLGGLAVCLGLLLSLRPPGWAGHCCRSSWFYQILAAASVAVLGFSVNLRPDLRRRRRV